MDGTQALDIQQLVSQLRPMIRDAVLERCEPLLKDLAAGRQRRKAAAALKAKRLRQRQRQAAGAKPATPAPAVATYSKRTPASWEVIRAGIRELNRKLDAKLLDQVERSIADDRQAGRPTESMLARYQRARREEIASAPGRPASERAAVIAADRVFAARAVGRDADFRSEHAAALHELDPASVSATATKYAKIPPLPANATASERAAQIAFRNVTRARTEGKPIDFIVEHSRCLARLAD